MSHASIATRGRETGGLTFSPPRSCGEEPGIRAMRPHRRTGASGTSPSAALESLRPLRQTFEFVERGVPLARRKRVRIELETKLSGQSANPAVDSDTPDGQVCLSIQDDGRGLDAASTNGRGMGMIGMRARARSSGGDVEVRAAPGGGVLIEVRVPLRNETHSHPAG